ncbi:biotin-independent malonate decarboxylase subunit gamma [Klebsiella pneumoniae]|nr:biotin-independent malonate decarboxylase subunit gamma [Klebsiella pneumoniae]
MSQFPNRAALWLNKLAPDAPLMSGLCPSVQVADGQINGENVRFIAVVPDANNHYPRAAGGEVGLLEGWTLAKVVNETIAADADQPVKRPIVAVIDVPSQAYGRREEAFGIHQALAGAAGAYAKARLAGHPVIGLIVGKAMSGAFLAHGYQANRLIAFNDSGVLVHAMGKASAARITLRTVEALEKLAATIPPMAYDVSNYATLGLLSALLDINNPDAPDDHDLSLVSNTLRDATAAALFLTGVILSARKLQLNALIATSTIVKLLVQPFIAWGLVMLLGLHGSIAITAILMIALAAGFFGVVFGNRFGVQSPDAEAVLLLSSVLCILSLPLFISLTSGL